MDERLRILVVGQTPPPHHGQAIMIDELLAGRFRRMELLHVRMAFSESIDEVGRISLSKLRHVGGVIRRITTAKLRYRPQVLYYPPAGPNRIPIYRDMAVLLAVRPLFRHVVFHFHAGGLTAIVPHLSAPERLLFHRAYGHPDLAIAPSELNPPDGERLGAKDTQVIPHGITDHYPRFAELAQLPNSIPRILFVGALRQSKGVMVLLEACKLLAARGLNFEVQIIGRFQSRDFESQARRFVAETGLKSSVSFPGVLTGDDKWRAYAGADLFCFPSYYESETFGVVVLEAMQFGLPVVATSWRGIPSLVLENETGNLVQIRDPVAVADGMEQLLRDPELRRTFGRAGRARYLAEYTLERWHHRMEEALLSVTGATL